MAMNTAGGESFLIPASPTSFVDRLYGGAVSFSKDANGNPELHWNFGKDFVARRAAP